MTDIGPGDWVEFIGKPEGYVNPPGEVSAGLAVGSVHQVTEIGLRCVDGAGNVFPSLRIPGLPKRSRRGKRVSVPVAAFRPIYRPKPNAFTSLLKTPELCTTGGS